VRSSWLSFQLHEVVSANQLGASLCICMRAWLVQIGSKLGQYVLQRSEAIFSSSFNLKFKARINIAGSGNRFSGETKNKLKSWHGDLPARSMRSDLIEKISCPVTLTWPNTMRGITQNTLSPVANLPSFSYFSWRPILHHLFCGPCS
jgi:hypothetical protein